MPTHKALFQGLLQFLREVIFQNLISILIQSRYIFIKITNVKKIAFKKDHFCKDKEQSYLIKYKVWPFA